MRDLVVDDKPKLIEVALQLAAIATETAREKSIRQGHPSTLAAVVGSAAVLAAARAEIDR